MKIIPSALLFDMDGTITDARQKIESDVLDVLESVPNNIKKYLVTGSDMDKIEERLLL